MLRKQYSRAAGILAVIGAAGAANAQFVGWRDVCVDYTNQQPPFPYSNDYSRTGLGTNLIGVTLGLSGTYTVGKGQGAGNYCYPTQTAYNVAGRFAFYSGNVGSVQSNFDNLLAYTMGAPTDPASSWCYATINEDGTRTRYGSNGFVTVFTGASDRYILAETVENNVRVRLRMDVVADAIRMNWTLTNQDAANPHNVGLWFGAWTAMRSTTGPDPNTGANQSGAFLNGQATAGTKRAYVFRPNGKPIFTEKRFRRATDPAGFPAYVQYLFGQSQPYGMQVDTGATASTTDSNGNSDATAAAELAVGDWFFLLGANGDQTFPDIMFGPPLPDGTNDAGDVTFDDSAYILKFADQSLQSNAARTIVHYIRSTWSVASYTAPYAVVADAPQLIESTTQSGANIQDGLRPNPMTIRLYVDNVRGFTSSDLNQPIQDVKVTITLGNGLSLAPGQASFQIIPIVQPKQIQFVDFRVVASNQVSGPVPYTFRVEPVPGPIKEITGYVTIASTPRLTVNRGANLVSLPWSFGDTSWEAILGIQSPTQYTAFDWDPSQQGYVVSTSASRARGTFIVTNIQMGNFALGGVPKQATDTYPGASIDPYTGLPNLIGPTFRLLPGWNLIGNPYNYSIKLSEIIGVYGEQTDAVSWQSLIQQNVVGGSLFYFDPNLGPNGGYGSIEGLTAELEANKGYWIYVYVNDPLFLTFPRVTARGLQNSQLGAAQDAWPQTDRKWALQLAVRSNQDQDAENYVGLVPTQSDVRMLSRMKPPASPVQRLQMSIVDTVNGKPAQLSRALVDGIARKEWTVKVTAKDAGKVTFTWPNISSIPKNVRLRVTDIATGATRDLRQVSGYTFTMDEAGSREFKLSVEPGSTSKAVIGNVVVTRTRDRNSPFSISYALSADATTSVRILSASGREVYTVSRGRADRMGENTVTWLMRDNANRNVAPGTYRVEILAETSDGERVRKIVPINVVR